MTKTRIAAWVVGIVLFFWLLASVDRMLKKNAAPPAASPVTATASAPPPPAVAPPPAAAGNEAQQGFLYGRITSEDGTIYEGRLRWGPDEEAFWSDTFNGAKKTNVWVEDVPPERVPKRASRHRIFGLQFGHGERPIDLGRLFMVRFGDIVRVEPRGRDVLVTLKSGTVFILNRFSASDFDDDVRVWDATRGQVDLDNSQIRSIEFLPTARVSDAPTRLYGTVRTKHGDFTGFVQWDREECTGIDELNGRTADGKQDIRFDTIRSIARRGPDSSLVTLLDGREIALGGTNDVGNGNRGTFVEDPRYGRVLIEWDVFERVDFRPDGSGPGYGDFPPGSPLKGSVTTRDGRHLTGRLVYDLDESETNETLDASLEGIDYSIPFGMIASVVPPGQDEQHAQSAKVTLYNGEVLQPESASDVGDGNAGLLIFVAGAERPEYVAWSEVQRIDFERPAAMYPPLGGS